MPVTPNALRTPILPARHRQLSGEEPLLPGDLVWHFQPAAFLPARPCLQSLRASVFFCAIRPL